MIGRKLHVRITARSIIAEVCVLDEYQRGRELVSSTDGIVAMETHRPAEERARRRWRVIARTEATGETESASTAARHAYCYYAEPEVDGIQVIDVGGASWTFLRAGTGIAWMFAPVDFATAKGADLLRVLELLAKPPG